MCIKLWAKSADDENDELKMLQESTTQYSENTCTFEEDECPNGEDVLNRINKVNENRARALSYLNTTQTCYKKNDEDIYYLYNDINEPAIIVIGIILGMMFLCCCCVICDYCYMMSYIKCRSKKKSKTILVLNQ